uniref:Uncharacterized protein n=1 Tax=Anguilla anguilla TaxID=7936 RepID=A0A0E9P968_ANGAN
MACDVLELNCPQWVVSLCRCPKSASVLTKQLGNKVNKIKIKNKKRSGP